MGVYCSFNQLLENGFYHADPHPGNLLRTDDGKLAYLGTLFIICSSDLVSKGSISVVSYYILWAFCVSFFRDFLTLPPIFYAKLDLPLF